MAITGRLPFDAGTLIEVFRQVCDDPLPIPSHANPDVPRKFDSWFAKACARAPEDRFPSASLLATTLNEACKGGHGRTDWIASALRDVPTRPFD